MVLTDHTESANIEVKGVEKDYQTIFKKDILAGRFLNPHDDSDRSKVAVIDTRTVEILAVSPQEIIGQYIQVGGILFRVIGVCEKGERWAGATVHIPFVTHQMLYSTDQKFDKMCVTMTAGTRGSVNKIRSLLCGPMQFDPSDKQAVGVERLRERYRRIFAVGIHTEGYHGAVKRPRVDNAEQRDLLLPNL